MNIPSNFERSFSQISQDMTAVSKERTEEMHARVGRWQQISTNEAHRGSLGKIEGSLINKVIHSFGNFIFRLLNKEKIEGEFVDRHVIREESRISLRNAKIQINDLLRVVKNRPDFKSEEIEQLIIEFDQLKKEHQILALAAQNQILKQDDFERLNSSFQELEGLMRGYDSFRFNRLNDQLDDFVLSIQNKGTPSKRALEELEKKFQALKDDYALLSRAADKGDINMRELENTLLPKFLEINNYLGRFE